MYYLNLFSAAAGAVRTAPIILLVLGCDTGVHSSVPAALSITPKFVAVTTSQSVQFHAMNFHGAKVSWEVDGIAGGSVASGTITERGQYLPPNAAGIHLVTARKGGETVRATVAVTNLPGVFTARYDRQRTGQNRLEYALTRETVDPKTFGKVFSCAVDGAIYAQPLYVANLRIADGVHNVVFVATQHNSLYAFDADRKPCKVYWQRKFVDETYLNLPREITAVPTARIGNTWDIKDEIGITGTPVIDPASETLYVVTKTREKSLLKRVIAFVRKEADGSQYHQRLHALSLSDGGEKFNGPAEISDALAVAGDGEPPDVLCPSPEGKVAFCAIHQHQRPALLLTNGKVYVAWASHGDVRPHYHGWVMGFNASDLGEKPLLFNTSPNGHAAAIWHMAGDDDGNIYVITGNGPFDTKAPRANFGNSFMKLRAADGKLSVVDFFTPFNQEDLNPLDLDLGSGGPVVLPDSVGSKLHPHLLVGGDKSGQLYLVDRNAMGGYCDGCGSNFNIVQQIGLEGIDEPCVVCGIFNTPAIWEGKLYVQAVRDYLKSYSVAEGRVSLKPISTSRQKFGYPGASPVVSSLGERNGIVWVIDSFMHGTPTGGYWQNGMPSPWPASKSGPAVLHAYDALNLTHELWNSTQAEYNRDQAGHAVKFAIPTVANGKVYIGTQTELTVYGLLAN
ncbi:MAG: hypothetical protein U1E63_10510 [Burkholderiales bacterium]